MIWLRRFRFLLWCLAKLVRHGWPRRVVHTYVGVGDELLAVSALHAINSRNGRGARGTWFLARYPSLHAASTLPVAFIPWDARILRLAQRLRRPISYLSYSRRDEQEGRDTPLPGHILTTFCRQLGYTGALELKPILELPESVLSSGLRHSRQIVVHSSSHGARVPIPSKQWPSEYMQTVVDGLRSRKIGEIIQLGTMSEPPIKGVHDLRGQLTLPESAAILARSSLFIGLAGGLMHLARAVDCPAVIIYGGRELTGLAGYPANENLVNLPSCAPCHLIKPCPFALACMTAITPADVLAAAERVLRRPRPLPVDHVVL